MSNKDLHSFQNDLIENESFIRWVKSEFEEDDESWSTYIDEHPDQMDDINKAIAFVRNFEFKDDPSFREKEVWDKISSSAGLQLTKEAVVKPLFANRLKVISLIAAACMLLVLVYRLGFNRETEVKTEYAQQMTESLPDGSSVILSPDSKINYQTKSWSKSRTIQLEGTAFFEVKKGNTFTVQTDLGSVTVLGTSFSVTSRSENFEVICKTGKVSVQLNSSDKQVILLPGDMVTLKADSLDYDAADMDKPNNIQWLEGVYTFESQSLKSVVEELERQYDVKVSLTDELGAMPYTGFFKKGNLEQALYSVTWPLGLKYSVTNQNQVTISK